MHVGNVKWKIPGERKYIGTDRREVNSSIGQGYRRLLNFDKISDSPPYRICSRFLQIDSWVVVINRKPWSCCGSKTFSNQNGIFVIPRVHALKSIPIGKRCYQHDEWSSISWGCGKDHETLVCNSKGRHLWPRRQPFLHIWLTDGCSVVSLLHNISMVTQVEGSV